MASKSQSENLAQHMTLFSLLSGHTLGRGPSVQRGGKPATGNLKPGRFPRGEGLKTLKPQELLAVRVPKTRIVNGKIEGYQRNFNAEKARSIARWIAANPDDYIKTLPVIEISIVGTGNDFYAFYTDGQHRGAGGVISVMPIRAVITRRTEDEARRLFTLQGKASRVSSNLLIIDSDGPFEEYIQDALTDEAHPWAKLISSSINGSSANRISASAAFTMLQIYVRGKYTPPGRIIGNNPDTDEFDKKAADELATLMSVFGTRTSNPLAYSSTGLRAIARSARAILMDHERHVDDWNRWLRHMPIFRFADYAYLKSNIEMANALIKHWNKQLPAKRKIRLID